MITPLRKVVYIVLFLATLTVLWLVPKGFLLPGGDSLLHDRSVPRISNSDAALTPGSVQTNLDPAFIFGRAFWRKPGKGDGIIAAEARTWLDQAARVERWQWFIAVSPSPELRHWLFEENPFELVAAGANSGKRSWEDAPAWFPTSSQLIEFAEFRAHGSFLALFVDPKTGNIFASDRGSGFAAAVR
jgi:hypothetical protein